MSAETLFDIDIAALERRIIAAARAASVNRFEVEFEWPECHKAKCQHRHGEPERAMGLMQHAIVQAIEMELWSHATTRPDVSVEGDSPEDEAVYTLAALLNRYNVHHAGTFVRAARLIVEAYPALIDALAPIQEVDRQENR